MAKERPEARHADSPAGGDIPAPSGPPSAPAVAVAGVSAGLFDLQGNAV